MSLTNNDWYSSFWRLPLSGLADNKYTLASFNPVGPLYTFFYPFGLLKINHKPNQPFHKQMGWNYHLHSTNLTLFFLLGDAVCIYFQDLWKIIFACYGRSGSWSLWFLQLLNFWHHVIKVSYVLSFNSEIVMLYVLNCFEQILKWVKQVKIVNIVCGYEFNIIKLFYLCQLFFEDWYVVVWHALNCILFDINRNMSCNTTNVTTFI